MRRRYLSARQDVAPSATELDARDGFAVESRRNAKSVGDQVGCHHRGIEEEAVHLDGMTEKCLQTVDVARREAWPVDVKRDQQQPARSQRAGELGEGPHAFPGIEWMTEYIATTPVQTPSAHGSPTIDATTNGNRGFRRRAMAIISGDRSQPSTSSRRSARNRVIWPGPQPISAITPGGAISQKASSSPRSNGLWSSSSANCSSYVLATVS
jgi:hypothetical protein